MHSICGMDPIIEEIFDPDRTKLLLPFIEKQATKASDKSKRQKQATKASDQSKRQKQAIKTSDKNKRQKQATANKSKKTSDHEQKLKEYLKTHGESNIQVLAECVGLSLSRTRAIIAKMPDVIPEGDRNRRTYHL